MSKFAGIKNRTDTSTPKIEKSLKRGLASNLVNEELKTLGCVMQTIGSEVGRP
jgi:hypothetical protein